MRQGIRWAVLAALLATLSPVAAEDSQDEAEPKRKSSLLEKLRGKKTPKKKKKKVPEKLDLSAYGAPGSFLLVRSDDSSGSAFMAEFRGNRVIVTNAHVYLTSRNPRIVDINNRRFKVTEILGARERDLVLLGFEPPPGKKPPALRIIPDAGRVPLNTPVVAFGNALGEDVVTHCGGYLTGIGARKIEVTAPIVPGNSGGPIFVRGTRDVIGISTYLVLVGKEWTTRGSRFEVTASKPVIRRFATRIDNLKTEELEPIDPAKIGAEIDVLEEFKKQMDRIFDLLRRHCSSSGNFLHEMRVADRMAVAGKARRWQSSYMKRSFERQAKVLEALGEALADIFPFEQLLRKHRGKFLVKRMEALRVKCFQCAGSRQISVYRQNPDFAPGRLESRYLIHKTTCPSCGGTGFRTLRTAGWFFIPEGKLLAEVQRRFQPDGSRLAGIPLGVSCRELRRQLPWYRSRRRRIGKFVNGMGYTYFFRGHHENPNITTTVLEYRFGRITSVSVAVKLPPMMSRSAFLRLCESMVEKSVRPRLCSKYIGSASSVPIDSAGRPLIVSVVRRGASDGGPAARDDGGFSRDRGEASVTRESFSGMLLTLHHPGLKPLEAVNFADFVTE